jgi:RNA polymerase sigma factor (sigma-70 family)
MYSLDVRSHQNAGVNRIGARFRSVVMPHLDAAYNLARWLTRNDADAEDIVQDACLRAFRGIGNFSNGNARAWVLSIVRHTAYAWLGKNRPATLVVTNDLEALERAETARCGSGAETPETAPIAKADAARLQAAIRKLPSPFRETLVLRDLQGLDYKEIAEVTEVPVGTVMSRLARARRRLIAITANDEACPNLTSRFQIESVQGASTTFCPSSF